MLGLIIGGATALAGAVGTAIQNKKNRKFAEKQATDSYNRQMDMYNIMKKDNSYEAQIEGLNKAGLSKTLMFGKVAGSSGGQGLGASAPKGDSVRGENPMAMMAGANLGLMKAQTDNIEADTEKKKIETNKLAGADTDNINQNTALAKQQERKIQLEANLVEIENRIKLETEPHVIDVLKQQAVKIKTEIADINKGIDVKETQIGNIKADTAKKEAETNTENVLRDYKEELMKADINQRNVEYELKLDQADLTRTQRKAVIQGIASGLSELKLKWTTLKEIDKTKVENEITRITQEAEKINISEKELELKVNEFIRRSLGGK